jgi:hypothetical protein
MGSYYKYVSHGSGSYIAIVLVNGFSLFILSCGLLIYGWMLKVKLSNNSIWESSERDRKLKIITRINSVLGICSICFFIRVLCLIAVMIDVSRNETLTDQLPLYSWFLISSWIPTLGPVRMTSKYTNKMFLIWLLRYRV